MSDKVLVLRNCSADYTSHNGFRWPKSGPVECLNWDPDPECDDGLHGLLWGRGDWSLLDYSPDAVWQVIEVDADSIVEIDDEEVKFRRGNVIYSGSMAEALTMVACHPDAPKSAYKVANGGYSTVASSGDNSTAVSTGNHSTAASSGDHSISASSGTRSVAASSGDSSRSATSGDYSAAVSGGFASIATSTGEDSTAASGGDSSVATSSGKYSQSASSGSFSLATSRGYESKAASSGYRSTAVSSGESSKAAVSGNYSTAVAKGKDTIAIAAGLDCIVSAGENGCFAAAWYDPTSKRNRIRVGYVGEDGLKSDTPYKITHDGRWEEVRER